MLLVHAVVRQPVVVIVSVVVSMVVSVSVVVGVGGCRRHHQEDHHGEGRTHWKRKRACPSRGP